MKDKEVLKALKKIREAFSELIEVWENSVWKATCPKCRAEYEVYEEPSKHGTFCPNCREIGYQLLGVLHFKQE